MLVSSVQIVEMCSTVFCTVYSFVMFVVDAIGDHVMEACYSIGLVMALYVESNVVAPFCGREEFKYWYGL